MRKEIDSSKNLPLQENLSRSAERAKYLQRGSRGRTKPFSLSKLLRGRQSGPCVETELPLAAPSRPRSCPAPGGPGRGPGEELLRVRPPGHGLATPEGPAAAGGRPEGTKTGGLTQQQRRAARRPEHGPPTGSHGSEPSRDQRGFVAEEQGASQSRAEVGGTAMAFAGRLLGSGLRGAGPGEQRRRGQAERGGAGRSQRLPGVHHL